MANLGGTFDAQNVEPNETRSFENLPPGKYQMQIVNSEMKDTSTGGQMLKLELDVLDGPATGRKLWDNLNLVNNNEKAVEIAQRTLSSICRAVGKMQVSDSEELHFKPMTVTVAVEPYSKTDAKLINRIKGYDAAGGAGRAAPAFQRPTQGNGGQAAAPAAAAPKAMPWARKSDGAPPF